LPVVIAQHMPAISTMLLAKRLATKWAMPARECQPVHLLQPSWVWIAAGGYHMAAPQEDHQIRLCTRLEPCEKLCGTSVHVRIWSVAAVYRKRYEHDPIAAWDKID
jgi:two-component system chemotaxis response regulator CheB